MRNSNDMTRWVGVLLFTLAGCHITSRADESAAVVTEHTQAGRTELEQVVGGAAGSDSIHLAEDVLMHSDNFVVERKRRRSMAGTLSGDRTMERPDHFRLVLSDGVCVLIHMETEKHYPLQEVSCRPL